MPQNTRFNSWQCYDGLTCVGNNRINHEAAISAFVTVTKGLQLGVKAIRLESANCISIVFDRPANFNYQPGDWIDLCFDDALDAGERTFSFSSSPTEPDLVITYKRGISPFKLHMQSLQVGDEVRVVQYGNSGFNLNKKHPIVILAGGVGITPFRSMVKELVDESARVDVTLIYQSKTDDFAFLREFDEWVKSYPYLAVQYLDSSAKERINKKFLSELVPANSDSQFYIAGPPGMVENTETWLIQLGVKSDAIFDDAFTGY